MSEGLRWEGEAGLEILKSLSRTDSQGFKSVSQGSEVLIESFDEPLVVQFVERLPGTIWLAQMPYDHKEEFKLHELSLDDFDRFHGVTLRGLPFVFSRKAQAQFFDMLDEFDDDSIHVNGERIEIKPWNLPSPAISGQQFWNERYQQQTDFWDLKEAHPSLPNFVKKLKWPRSQIAVLGSGAGHDAAYLAGLGHLVTAVDFSPLAVASAKKRYGDRQGLCFIEEDVFKFARRERESFDIVFDHTFFCAVEDRAAVSKAWHSLLKSKGHLLAIFFVVESRKGPPYGASEWEIRKRLTQNFDILYWERLRDSPSSRQGKELMVYAEKKS